MQIYNSNTVPASRAPEENFTGNVTIGGYFRREAPSRIVSATVTCTPGSRTPWKVNPLGQTLVVLSGVGWAQCQGEEIVEIREGDMVWCAPGASTGKAPRPIRRLPMLPFRSSRATHPSVSGRRSPMRNIAKGRPTPRKVYRSGCLNSRFVGQGFEIEMNGRTRAKNNGLMRASQRKP